MSSGIDDAIGRLDPIDLDQLNRQAKLLRRRDRKYLVEASRLAELLGEVPSEALVLETETGRWGGYETTYYDTLRLDSYRLAVTKRPRRWKVRTRRYGGSEGTMLEVKTKDRRGRTVKHRRRFSGPAWAIDEATRDFAGDFAAIEPYAPRLAPHLTSTYHRATAVLPDHGTRCTIDIDYRAVDRTGRSTGLAGVVIVETKTDGGASPIDRILWGAGKRPVRFSKYATAIAVLDPELPANRRHRTIVDYFDRAPTSARPSPSKTTTFDPSALVPAAHAALCLNPT